MLIRVNVRHVISPSLHVLNHHHHRVWPWHESRCQLQLDHRHRGYPSFALFESGEIIPQPRRPTNTRSDHLCFPTRTSPTLDDYGCRPPAQCLEKEMGDTETDVGDYRLFHTTQRGRRASFLNPGQPNALAAKSPRVAAHSFSQAFHTLDRRLGRGCRVSTESKREVSATTSGRDPRSRKHEVERTGGWKRDS